MGSTSWLAEILSESLKAAGRHQHQHLSGRRACNLEAVRNIPRTEHEVARSGSEPLAVAHECHASLEHIKGFVFTVMNMVGGSEPGRQHRMLN